MRPAAEARLRWSLCAAAIALVAVAVLWDICPDFIVRVQRYTDAAPFGEIKSVGWPNLTKPYRVLQISDPQVGSVWDRCKDTDMKYCDVRATTRFIARLVRDVAPDFVVVTGDLVFGPRAPTTELHAVLRPLGDVPHAVILGNHDVQRCAAWDQRQMTQYVYAGPTLGGTSLLRIGNGRACLWMIDYSYTHPGWVNPRHLEWIRSSRAQCTGAKASLAFIHFPIGNFSNAKGSQHEPVDHPANTTALQSTLRSIPALKAVGFGHDHVNDFCGIPDALGIHACYAGSVGYTTYGRRGFARRARVFQLGLDGSVTTYKVTDGSLCKLSMRSN